MSKKGSKKGNWTRRAFMITGSVVGGGLLVGVGGLVYVNKKIKEYSGLGFEGEMINAWVSISSDNQINIAVPRAEMGQGVYTSVPMLIAEELEVEMSQIRVVAPQPESPYANTVLLTSQPRDIYKGLSMMEKVASFIPIVGTGGSTTIQDGYDNMRMAGALAREMLISAAAKEWNMHKRDCYAEKGQIFNRKNNKYLTYGKLAHLASQEPTPQMPPLKEMKDFKLLGKPLKRLDVPEKVTGQAQFGIDIRLDNMLYAVIRHASTIGGSIIKIKNIEEVETLDGVKKVILTPYGAAVVADNTWRAKNAAIALEIEETDNGFGSLSSESISTQLTNTIDKDPIATPENNGNVVEVFQNASNVLESTYEVPYLAHATMEPINCTVLVEDDRAEVWSGHQSTSIAQSAVSEILDISKSKILVHTTYLGGGFGRRTEKDMVLKAAHIANEMKGTPVQLVFTREEDMKNDMYRPAVISRFKAAVEESGEIKAWDNMIALQSVANSSMNRIMPSMATNPKDDISTTEGAIHLPYQMSNRRVAFGQVDLPIEVGFWRSVGNSQNGFFTESFIDECAHEVGQDPFEFRRQKLKDHPRFLAVLERVAKMSQWGKALDKGRYRGIALHKSFGSIVGQIAEITHLGEKEFSIDNYYCAIDCGRIVNPNTIEAQMQSGIIFGLSAALFGEITIQNGKIQQENFPQYEMVKMGISPHIEVAIMNVDAYPGGVGEPGTPPAAPALANAIFAATGERIRSLPLKKHGYSFV